MPASHKFAESDGEGRNKKPSWEHSVSDRADCKREDRAQKAMYAREAAAEAKQHARSYNQKRVHQQDS